MIMMNIKVPLQTYSTNIYILFVDIIVEIYIKYGHEILKLHQKIFDYSKHIMGWQVHGPNTTQFYTNK